MPSEFMGCTRFALAILIASSALWAQTFEVASIKAAAPITDGGFTMGCRTQISRTICENLTLSRAASLAYKIDPRRVVDGPAWIGTDFFNISATFVPPATSEEFPVMLKALLADRFLLRAHVEAREAPVYELQIAKKGAKLTPSSPDENAMLRDGRFKLAVTKTGLSDLAMSLRSAVDRPIIDKTGLKGLYNFDFEWGTEETGPSLFTVLEERYGLKLMPVKAPLDFLVVDNAERPTAN